MFLFTTLLGIVIFKKIDTYFSNKLKDKIIIYKDISEALYLTILSFIFALGSTLFMLELIEVFKLHYFLGIGFGGLLYNTHYLFKTNQFSMCIHHIIMEFAIIIPILSKNNILFYNNDYNIILSRTLLCEWTNIFLNLSYILLKLNMNHTIIFKLSNIILLIGYIFLRLINFTSIQLLLYERGDQFILYFMGIPLTILNYYWFIKLFNKFINFIKVTY